MCDQIVANGFLFRQRVVNAPEEVAHLHENVPRVVGAICVTVEVQLGPKISYEVSKHPFSACLHPVLLGFVTQHSVDFGDETLNLVHRTSP